MEQTSDIFSQNTELRCKYEIIGLLGEGANGKTYRARNRATGGEVAIKALKLSDDIKTIDLFKREAEVLKSIRITGVPQFHESIIPENPLVDPCFIIQEYVEYPSLQNILDNGYVFTEEETLQIMEKMAEILVNLQTLYSPPIIHRDIKPSNILCVKDDNGDVQLFLIDFGAVANPQKKSGGSTIAGTFGYMAPEQMMGDVCVQTDFYSLGATALHLLTGRSPAGFESNMFKLDVKSILKEYSQWTSSRMIELLECMLDPVVNNRPSSAVQLQEYIQIVQEGSSILEAQKKNKSKIEFIEPLKTSWFGRFRDWLLRNDASHNRLKHVRTTANWKTTEGTIQAMTVLANEQCYEFTFEVNGQTYSGMSVARYSEKKYTPNELPQKAKVLYCPQFPRLCMVNYSRS